MLKKNCHQVLGSQKSKLTPLELIFRTAGAINNPPLTRIVLKQCNFFWIIFLSDRLCIKCKSKQWILKFCHTLTWFTRNNSYSPNNNFHGCIWFLLFIGLNFTFYNFQYFPFLKKMLQLLIYYWSIKKSVDRKDILKTVVWEMFYDK